jgi:hypothetical protein
VLASAFANAQGERTAVIFYALAFDLTALTFNAVWHYSCRRKLFTDALHPTGLTAISRRFGLALVWLTSAALLGAIVPILGLAAIAGFNVFYWLPIRAESRRSEPEAPAA